MSDLWRFWNVIQKVFSCKDDISLFRAGLPIRRICPVSKIDLFRNGRKEKRNGKDRRTQSRNA